MGRRVTEDGAGVLGHGRADRGEPGEGLLPMGFRAVVVASPFQCGMKTRDFFQNLVTEEKPAPASM